MNLLRHRVRQPNCTPLQCADHFIIAMDDFIGELIEVFEDLKFKRIFDNSIIIFVSDNGGLNTNIGGASNLSFERGKG